MDTAQKSIEARLAERQKERKGLMVDFQRASYRFAGPSDEEEGQNDLVTMQKVRLELDCLDAKISELRWVLSQFDNEENVPCPA